MVTVKRSKMQRYGVAVLAVVLAILLMLLLNPWVGMSQSPFLMFFGAVMVSAWYGGMGAGLVATILSALLSSYFFIYPTYWLVVELSDIVRLSVFVLEGVLISALCEALRNTNRRLEVSVRKFQTSEERYRRLIDTAYEGIWILDVEGRINYVNQRMAEMLGYSVLEMLERPVFNFMDDEARIIAKRNLERRKQGITEQYDFQFRCQDGSELWTTVSTNPIFSQTGEFEGELAMMTDVSNVYSELRLRKQAENALRETQKIFESFMNHAPVTAFIRDDAGRYIYVNRLVEHLFNRKLADWVGKTDFDFFPPEAVKQWRDNDEAVLATGKTRKILETVPLDDGEHYYLSFKFPLQDASGRGLLGGMSLDISDRKRLEDKLRQSEARFRCLLESNIIGIFFPELDGKIFEANDAFLQMVGYKREDLLAGKVNWKDMTPPEYQELDELKVEELKTVGTCTPFEKEYIRKDGTRIPILVGAAVLPESEQSTVAFALDLSDRKQAELALRQSEAKFRRLFDANIVGIIFPDLSGNIFDANDAFLDMVGYTREDLLAGRVRWDVMTPPEYRHVSDRSIEELKTFGVCSPFEKEYIRKDGSRVPVLLIAALLEGSEQNNVSFILDLSERKRAEQERAQLLEREQAARSVAEAARKQVSLIIESITDGFLAFDSEWRFTYLNHEGARTLGRPPEELLGKNLWEEFPELSNTSFGQLYQRVFAERVALELEDYYPPFEAWFAVRAYPTEIGGLSLYFRNISDRKQTESALRESEERFRHMADTAPVLIWMSGPDKLCNYFNKPWLDFTGRTMEQELGNGWTQGVHPDDFPRCLDTYVNAFDARQDFRMEYRLRRFDAEYCWVLDNGIPRFTPDGSFLGYIGSCMDISDRKLAEAAIQQLNESLEHRVQERTAQLEAANQELESFSYSVSHDLRAPLRHISGFVDLLQKRAAATLDETSLRYLNTIAQTTKQAGTLIDNLLAFSRMGRTQMRCTTIDMNQLVREVQRDIELETHGRAICWQVEELASVQGDPSLLRLVLSNLIENAVKYTQTRAQAEIEIGCTENDSEVVFFIRDNGVGFDMRYVHKLFGVFQRLHSAEEFEGTGIGLANVQRIIHRHGGKTWAEGVVDGGATFYFSLPQKG